jgi:hypothetical protein
VKGRLVERQALDGGRIEGDLGAGRFRTEASRGLGEGQRRISS